MSAPLLEHDVPVAPAVLRNGSEAHPDAARWAELADRVLPLRNEEDANWRFSRGMRADEPSQGWKLHVSATVLNAVDVLQACSEYLLEHDILFKACSDLRILARLNAGIFYGFSQVGKFITVYPRDATAARRIAEELDRRTRAFAGPRVPFDLPYRPGGIVYYRYGGFRMIEVIDAAGDRSMAIRDPKGKLWTDRREPGHVFPDWLVNPFTTYRDDSPPQLQTDFLVYEALSQRGKGGVYLAIDIRSIPARKCVIKEGRRNGETALDGSDGVSFVQREEVALRSLREQGVAVPEVLGCFDAPGHRYLALEHLEGTNLMALCTHPRVKLPLRSADSFAAQIARLVAAIHARGWVWRDLKPLNLIVSPGGELRPIDFEGAVAIDEPCDVPWGTPGYAPPDFDGGAVTGSNAPEDLYALGATLFQLYSSFVPVREDADDSAIRSLGPLGVRRKGVHPDTRALVAALLSHDPAARPSAQEAAEELSKRETTSPLQWREVRRRIRRRAPSGPLEPVIPGVERVVLHTDEPAAADAA